MYDDYEDYYEPSEIDILLDEFKEKCRDLILPNVKEEISSYIKEITKLKEENEKFKIEIKQLKNDNKIVNEKSKSSILIDNILHSINKNNIIEFVESIYKRDYKESWSVEETPLWLGLLTEYYSHKEEIIEMLKTFNIRIPDNINNFRLPIDWNEEELDIFFNTLYNHYNCNGNTYEYNLNYWSGNSLKSVKEQCRSQYSEIPWQYVLRNPLLKNEKYLKLMGQKMIGENFRNGCYFAKISYYQQLSDDEIKVILNNINYDELKNIDSLAGKFILGHISLIDNDKFIGKIYTFVQNKYNAFDYIKNMSSKYIKKYLLDNKENALKLLKEDINLSKEDKQEVIQALIS